MSCFFTFLSVIAVSHALIFADVEKKDTTGSEAEVISISSGDTASVHVTEGSGKASKLVRLSGIRAPLKDTRDYRLSKEALEKMVKRKKVEIRFIGDDPRGGKEGIILLDGKDIRLDLVESGMASVSDDADDMLKAAEKKAIEKKAGMWHNGGKNAVKTTAKKPTLEEKKESSPLKEVSANTLFGDEKKTDSEASKPKDDKKLPELAPEIIEVEPIENKVYKEGELGAIFGIDLTRKYETKGLTQKDLDGFFVLRRKLKKTFIGFDKAEIKVDEDGEIQKIVLSKFTSAAESMSPEILKAIKTKYPNAKKEAVDMENPCDYCFDFIFVDATVSFIVMARDPALWGSFIIIRPNKANEKKKVDINDAMNAL